MSLKIDYTEEMISGEPGPNLYIFGTRDDFDWLQKEIQMLLNLSVAHLELINSERIRFENGIVNRISIRMEHENLSRIVVGEPTIIFYLTKEYLLDLEKRCLGLSQRKVHDYVDWTISGMNFNLIISSEW
jgi:hypothetical protein